MSKGIRRIAVLIMSAIICFSGVMTLSTVTVEAKAKPKLSSKSVTLAMGGQQKITLKGGKGKWSIQDNGVVHIAKQNKKSVTITPVNAGTATLTCEAGKKKLKCKVTVLNNTIGTPEGDLGGAIVVGKSNGFEYRLNRGVTLTGVDYDKSRGSVTVKTTADSITGITTVSVNIKALKPGRFKIKMNYLNGSTPASEMLYPVFINGFRGNAKAKKTDANYKKWRQKIIADMVTPEMDTWEIIDAIGTLISTGKYSSKGGATGKQLWYGGNGTCVSGAKMMNDFMKDLGINSKVHFAGNSGGAKDIFGYTLSYASGHKNVWVTLDGKRYEINPQPGMPWPIGTVKR